MREILCKTPYQKPELLVDRKYNVDNILEAFNKVRLEYELEAVGKFYKFTFKEYQSVDFIFNKNIPLTNSYYDYIIYKLFVILIINTLNHYKY